MNTRVRVFLHGLVLILALTLIVGGIVTAKYGAIVIGIIVAGVSAARGAGTGAATSRRAMSSSSRWAASEDSG